MAKVNKTAVTDNVRRKNDTHVQNKYYILVSDRYMRAKIFTIILLVSFFAFMMIRFEEDITYSNLMYLLRDFDTDSVSVDSDFANVEYDEQENMSFAMYKGELSVIGNRSLKMYNVRGEETRSYETGFSDPALAVSDKYLLAYSVGSPYYSVFTSIAKVNSDEAPGNIECADVNSKGEYLLVCRSKDTKYVVCAYDSSFRPAVKYYKNRYVTSVEIGDDGKVLIVSFDSAGVSYDCELELYNGGSDKPDSVYTETGIFPVKCGFFNNGSYYLICTDRVLFFNKNGELKSSTESSFEYTAYAVSENRLAVASSNNSLGGNSEVIVFDTEGKMLYNKKISGNISSLSLTEDSVYIFAGSKVCKITENKDEVLEKEVNEGGAVLLSYGDSAVLCRRNGAEGILLGKEKKENITSTENVTSSVSG